MTLIVDTSSPPATAMTGHAPVPPRELSGAPVLPGGRSVVDELHQEILDLRRQLDTQPSIEQAKGLLMGYYGIEADTAFAVLRRWSQHHNIKIRVLSAGLVTASSQPSDRPYGALLALMDRLGTSTAG